MHDVATTMWDLTRTHYTYAMKVTSDAPTPAAKQSKAADITPMPAAKRQSTCAQVKSTSAATEDAYKLQERAQALAFESDQAQEEQRQYVRRDRFGFVPQS